MSKAKRSKKSYRSNYPKQPNNIIQLQEKRLQRKCKIDLLPRNIVQEDYINALLDDSISIVVTTGPAGCGKTWLATLAAMKALHEGRCDKIVITRPNRAVDDKDIGFLPGDIFAKMTPWMLPILDIFKEYYSPKEIEYLIDNEVIEICPIAFIRGRTMKNSFILVDEAQGTTDNSIFAIMTRIGENSKMVITGDVSQSDIGPSNGLQTIANKLNRKNYNLIKLISFSATEVVRSAAVREVLRLFSKDTM